MTTCHDSPPPSSCPPVRETDLPYPDRRQGKVRDIYRVPSSPSHAGGILFVASDRISAFDVVLPTVIPGKGRLLTEISTFWFTVIRELGLIGDHLLGTDPGDLPDLTDADRAMLQGRMMLGRPARVIPIECVVRGYLAGSGWKEYQEGQAVCGIALPAGLQCSSQLPEPIFTPSTKEDVGHDENIDYDRACDIASRDVMDRLRDVSLTIFEVASRRAQAAGIILADTKFEFGHVLAEDGTPTDEIILIDEVLTPDSSRYWPADEYDIGREQNSFDKQIVRTYLQGLVDEGAWDKTDPGPVLPENIVDRILTRYREARDILFG